MPWGDWQFWIVSLLGLAGLWFVIKPLLPNKSKSGSCPSCASGSTSKEKKGQRVGLTIERKHVK